MYDYDTKYLITAVANIGGMDPPSLLQETNGMFFLPSQPGWRISQESFFKNMDFINDLKVRGGWGQTGKPRGIERLCSLWIT